MEGTLFEISRKVKGKNLEEDIYEQCRKHIEESVNNSTIYHFE